MTKLRRNNAVEITEKLTKDNYKELLKKQKGDEYEFIEEYITSKTPILCRHNICMNEYPVAPYEIIKRNVSCPKCFFKSKTGEKVFNENFEKFKKDILEHYGYMPYTFLSEYKTIKDDINVICNRCGYEFSVKPGNVKNNIRLNREPVCKKCSIERTRNSAMKPSADYENEIMELFGYKAYDLLEDYKGTNTKIKHKCNKCEYEFDVEPSNIIYAKKKHNRNYCPNCNDMVRDLRPYEERLADARGTEIFSIEEFKGSKVKINHMCNKCKKTWMAQPSNILSGSGCPHCANTVTQSKVELEVIDFIKNELNISNIITCDRTILKGKELDIYLPDYKLAIEVNGTYWHCDDYKDKNYHINKTIECEKLGVRLIHLFDDEWNDITKSKIQHILGKNNNPKIYARKCYVELLDSKTKNEFLINNHIQGKDISSINLGLWYRQSNNKDILVAVMTFSKLRKCLGNSKSEENQNDFELSRFSTDINYHVVGGFSKLLSYFKNNYDFNKLITYADRRYSLGNLYETNNFKFSHFSKPSYSYINRNTKERKHRFNFRKQNLKELFPHIYSDDKTEFQIMDETKIYKRVWDCGNYVFILDGK